MITSTSRPYIIGACVALTFVLFLSLQSRQESSTASSNWLDYSDKTPISPEHRNYASATSGTRLKPADTTSEIGRASNATLGVCASFPPRSMDIRVLLTQEQSSLRECSLLDYRSAQTNEMPWSCLLH